MYLIKKSTVFDKNIKSKNYVNIKFEENVKFDKIVKFDEKIKFDKNVNFYGKVKFEKNIKVEKNVKLYPPPPPPPPILWIWYLIFSGPKRNRLDFEIGIVATSAAFQFG